MCQSVKCNHSKNSSSSHLSRRQLLGLGISTVPLFGLALSRRTLAALQPLTKPVRIGLIADLHQDIMHDGLQRMQAFAKAMSAQPLDAVMQLGDFAYPADKNRAVIDQFNATHDTALHVIGNHDTDAGHTKQQCLDVWGMPNRYYTTDVGGLQLVVLDCNDKGSPTHGGGYPSYVGEEQLAWLDEQLEQLTGPIVVVSHQPLAGPACVDNAADIQQRLTKAADKVLLAINGHTHIDALRTVAGIPYLHVNSASYFWMGGDYQHRSYPDAIHDAHPWIDRTCPYREPLFTTLTLDPENLTLTIEGCQSHWVGDSPKDLGLDKRPEIGQDKEITPAISARTIKR